MPCQEPPIVRRIDVVPGRKDPQPRAAIRNSDNRLIEYPRRAPTDPVENRPTETPLTDQVIPSIHCRTNGAVAIAEQFERFFNILFGQRGTVGTDEHDSIICVRQMHVEESGHPRSEISLWLRPKLIVDSTDRRKIRPGFVSRGRVTQHAPLSDIPEPLSQISDEGRIHGCCSFRPQFDCQSRLDAAGNGMLDEHAEGGH